MTSSHRNPPEPGWSRVLLAILIVLCLIFMVSYAGRLVEKWRVEQQITVWTQRLAQADESQAALVREREHVQGPDYVDEAARSEFGLSKPGDQVIVIVEATPTAQLMTAEATAGAEVGGDSGQSTSSGQPPVWQQWWQLFTEPVTETP